MTNGEPPWYEWGLEIGKWILAGIATLGSSAALWAARRYRLDSDRLNDAHEYFERLKRQKAAARLVAYRREIAELKNRLDSNERKNEELRELVRTNNNKIDNYQASSQNLITLVEVRGKEHHEHRETLQQFVNRLVIVETKLQIKQQWTHDGS